MRAKLTAEQLARQRQGMGEAIARADVVITTAQVFGRPAPRIVDRDMVAAMRPGSVVVDMAVETGGNVEGSRLDEIVDIKGVQVIGFGNLPSEVASNASAMYAANVTHLLDEFWNPQAQRLELNEDDEIVAGCVLTRGGAIVNEAIKKG